MKFIISFLALLNQQIANATSLGPTPLDLLFVVPQAVGVVIDTTGDILDATGISSGIQRVLESEGPSKDNGKEGSLGHIYYKEAIKYCQQKNYTLALDSFRQSQHNKYITNADEELKKCSNSN